MATPGPPLLLSVDFSPFPSQDPPIKIFGKAILPSLESPSDEDLSPRCVHHLALSGYGSDEENVSKISLGKQTSKGERKGEIKILRKPDKPVPCPRCESMDTKFCYFNNYNTNQPRHFCRNCQRYWTAGGTLRNVPVGAGRRKNKHANQQKRLPFDSLIMRSDSPGSSQPDFIDAEAKSYGFTRMIEEDSSWRNAEQEANAFGTTIRVSQKSSFQGTMAPRFEGYDKSRCEADPQNMSEEAIKWKETVSFDANFQSKDQAVPCADPEAYTSTKMNEQGSFQGNTQFEASASIRVSQENSFQENIPANIEAYNKSRRETDPQNMSQEDTKWKEMISFDASFESKDEAGRSANCEVNTDTAGPFPVLAMPWPCMYSNWTATEAGPFPMAPPNWPPTTGTTSVSAFRPAQALWPWPCLAGTLWNPVWNSLPWGPVWKPPAPATTATGTYAISTQSVLGKRLRGCREGTGEVIGEGSLYIPKTVRIHDPEEAAHSSILTILGVTSKSEALPSCGILSTFQPKGEVFQSKSKVLEEKLANPVAIPSSMAFQESNKTL